MPSDYRGGAVGEPKGTVKSCFNSPGSGAGSLRPVSKRLISIAVGLAALATVPLVAARGDGANANVVTQSGQKFHPRELSINKGTTVKFINDDGELIHHVYIASKDFNYDSGDQEPGTTRDIVFDLAGTFTVLCGIHPKMRLDVTVR